MNDPKELFARVVEWRRSTDPDTWRVTRLVDDLATALRAALAEVGEWREENRVLVAAVESLNRKLRAALAARPQPLAAIEAELNQWAQDIADRYQCNPGDTRPARMARMLRAEAVAGSVTPTHVDTETPCSRCGHRRMAHGSDDLPHSPRPCGAWGCDCKGFVAGSATQPQPLMDTPCSVCGRVLCGLVDPAAAGSATPTGDDDDT